MPGGSLKRIFLALGLSLVLGLAGLYLVVGEKLFDPRIYRIENASAPILALCAVALGAEWLMPAVRVRLLCLGQRIQIPYGPALMVHLISVFGAVVTPGNSGGAPTTAVVLNRIGVPFGKSLGVILQIFILDLFLFAWTVPLSLGYLVYSRAIALPRGVDVLALMLAALALFGAVALGRYPRPFVRALLAAAKWPLLCRFDARIRKVARDYYRSSRAYRSTTFSMRLALNVVTAVHWVAPFVLLWGILKLYGINVGLVVTLALLNVLTMVSNLVPTPGGAGFVEAAIGFAVGPYARSGSVAAALLVWRIVAFYIIFLLGPLAAWLLFLRFRADDVTRRSGERKRPARRSGART